MAVNILRLDDRGWTTFIDEVNSYIYDRERDYKEKVIALIPTATEEGYELLIHTEELKYYD